MSDFNREREPLIFGKDFAQPLSDAAYAFAQLVQRLEMGLLSVQDLEQKIEDLDEKLVSCANVFSAFLQRAPLIEEAIDALDKRLLTVEEGVDAPLGPRANLAEDLTRHRDMAVAHSAPQIANPHSDALALVSARAAELREADAEAARVRATFERAVRLAEGFTHQQIADAAGLSRQRVQQILAQDRIET